MIPSETGAARNIYHPGGHSGDEMEMPAGVEISQPPSAIEIATDRIFRRSTLAVAWFTIILVFWVVISIGRQAMPAIHTYGLSFLSGTTWDANRAHFGILPAIVGTLV